MNRLNRRLVLIIIIVSSILGMLMVWRGFTLTLHLTSTRPEGKLWLKEGSFVEPFAYRVAWGVSAAPAEVPSYWLFKIHFKSNTTVSLNAFWDDPSHPFIEMYGSEFDEVKLVKVVDSKAQCEWTWYIKNDTPYYASIEMFVVEYSGAFRPYEGLGTLLIYSGVILLVASLLASVYFVKFRRVEE